MGEEDIKALCLRFAFGKEKIANMDIFSCQNLQEFKTI